jgi:peptidylprolyl isomerase
VVIAAFLIVGCAPGGASPTQAPTAAPKAESAAKPAASPAANTTGASKSMKQWPNPPAMAIDPNKAYTATISTSAGEMKAQLFPKEAPNTVNNFVFLAREGFYDGVPFHRIISGFMVQTGDPTGSGRGGPGYRFNDELPREREYERGTLAMANAGPNTQGSQFFICHQDLRGGRLPKNYTIFGKVTDGLDILDKIASTPVRPGPSGEPSQPTQDVRITKVTISEG